MKNIPKNISLLVLLALVSSITSCGVIIADYLLARPDKLAATRAEQAYGGRECANGLIIAIMKDKTERVAMENIFADRLIQQGLPVTVGSIKVPDIASLQDKNVLTKLSGDDRIDQIITVELKDVTDEDQSVWLRNWVATPFPAEDLTKASPGPGVTKSVRFEITVWDAKMLRREWTGSTHPVDRYDVLRQAPEAAGSTALSLIREKILWPAKPSS